MSSSFLLFTRKPGMLGAVLVLAMAVFFGAAWVVAASQGDRSSVQKTDTLDVTAALAGTEPIFVSDYFSFVGSDEKGHVVFAIDNDRTRRGKKYKADAHVVLHDEHEGWIKVSGAGKYDNKKKELIVIPDSKDFQFTGEVKRGIALDSPHNQLTLEVDAMNERVNRTGGDAIYSMGSTSATLKWRDRVIRGRVIYEYIFMKNLSPWYSAFSGLFFNDFQGLYLKTSEGDDFYLHTLKGETWSHLIERIMGFQVIEGRSEILRDLHIEVPERSFGFGFYRWPKIWRVSWQGSKGTGSLSLRVVDQKTVTNWLIGGFAMTVVTGDLSYGGKTRPVYGLAELIR